MEQEEENLQRLLKWAAEFGISDSTSCGHSCLGHSLVVSYFPGAGGYAITSNYIHSHKLLSKY
jgi:hypothetical protein